MEDPAKPSASDLPVCRLVQPSDASALGRLFARLRSHGVEEFFHPHPLTPQAAGERATYLGKDVYCVMAIGEELVGYGMLRGWDDGYDIPNLGVAIDPGQQGRGYGRRLMEFLHRLARQRGAKRIRLRVYPENARAVALYQSLGYSLNCNREPDGQIVGFLELLATEPPSRS
jgi:[ribosomal protein S18]-alanine N-acetyltransferase